MNDSLVAAPSLEDETNGENVTVAGDFFLVGENAFDGERFLSLDDETELVVLTKGLDTEVLVPTSVVLLLTLNRAG